ncbi:MAG: inositol monophosphatase [Pseudomonadales bacterium]|uniref:Inositol-1-monophosphatase n=1 Tax=Oleiphilus messinensis TaxID=141451 RepID=A0A1Y0ID78_9GAMM|nr:inositol monophosphatase family protein [Oleiphilus messinensis]ARU58512.1 fructose-1 6-bisphosphatase [Oleiphilus messinensis]MCG8613297.1 inositol monophosphatase [Pseudomonadales bacterium]
MGHDNLHEISIFAVDLAMRAGELIKQGRQRGNLEQHYKSGQELVTEMDLKVDEMINKHIRKIYPDHRILSEETNPDLTLAEDLEDPIWIIDPIDGTVNYAYNHHQVAISIAFATGGKVQVGVVHCPFQNETFQAIAGGQAMLNHRPIKPSASMSLETSLIGTGFPYQKNEIAGLILRLKSVLSSCRDIRRIGSAAIDICWVAMGRLDGYYESLSPWDFAAAQLIARTAGAQCGHIYPPPEGINPELFDRDLLITNPHIHEPLRDLLIAADEAAQ